MRAYNKNWMGLMAAICMISSIFAADGVWTNTAGGNWSDAANWKDGVVAEGVDAMAYFTNAPIAHRTVMLPEGGVTLGGLLHDRCGTTYQIRLRGGPLLFDGSDPEIFSERIFTLFYTDIQGTNGLVWHGGVVSTDTSYTGPTTLASGIVYDYMHLGALSQASSISNYLSTGPLIFDGGSLVVSGRANSSASSSEWYLTEGDTIVRKVATGLLASPGATVTGTGIPDGAFVKHNIDSTSFEISQAATESGTNTLLFGAISGSESHQKFERIEMNASGYLEVLNNRGSLTRVQADGLTGGGFALSKRGDGTLALKGKDCFGGVVDLNGGTLELLAGLAGEQPALSNVTMTGRTVISVPEVAMTATLVNVSGMGELVKSGAGSLVVGSTAGSGTRITVENGSLTIASEAIPVKPVAGSWFHVDASDPGSLSLVFENGTNFVTQWRDTRTNGVTAFAAADAPRPFLRDGFQNGLSVVDFGSFHYPEQNITGYGGYLNWSEPCATVREVFMVFSDTPDAATLPSNLNSSFLLGHNSSYQFHRGFEGALLAGFASPNLRSGICSVDGETVPFSHKLAAGFHLVRFSTTGPVNASAFANDRNLSHGGQLLAEVVIYDHPLSEAERQATSDYLSYKWFERDRLTIGHLSLNGDGVLAVEAGDELRVGLLEVGGVVVKTGSGVLRADVISDAGGSLSVADGSIVINQPAESAAAPASAPWFHVDASDAASVRFVAENGTNFVTRWADVRTNGIMAEPVSQLTRPVYVSTGQNGLPYIDFGKFSYDVTVGQHLLWNQSCDSLRTIFLVYSDAPGENRCNIVSSGRSPQPYNRGVNGQFLSSLHASPYVLNGLLLIDGESVSASTTIPTGFHLIESMTAAAVAVDRFARDRGYNAGGQRLAEVLVYDRVLTFQERRNTEDYLLRKWLGFAVSGNESGLSGIVFTNNADLGVEGAGGKITLGWIDANDGVVKSGDGELNVGILGAGISRLMVENGGLKVSGSAAGAWFHVDASDPGSLSLVFENGTNFVTQWRDTRTNGVTAFAAADAPRPFLRENFQNGLPVVDFGSFHYPGLNIMGYGGYLNWSESCTGIREGFMVFSDTPDTAAIPSNVNSSFLLGHNSLYGFHRGFEGALLIDPYASANLRNGSWNVDGQTVSFSHQLAAGFHLISFATTGPVTASRFARDRQSSAGGQRLAEVLIYTNVLSAGFRQGMQSHLLGKWKNQARSFAQVRATGGSMITLAAGVMDIALLEGSGAVKASRIAVDLLSPGDVAGQVGALSVTGDLDFNDGAVVTIDCIPPACDSIDVDGMLSIMGGGTFVFSGSVGTGIPEPVAVFTFDTVTGAENLKNWSVMGEVTAHYVVKPRIVGNQLMLIFLPKGTVILIR